MLHFRSPLVLALAAFTVLPSGAPAADELTGVFAKIDQAASGFRGLSADIRRVKHTPVIPDDEPQTGKIFVRRAKPHELQLKIDIDPPDQQEVVFDGTKVEIYYPKQKSIQPYLLGKNSPMVDQVLALGWGSTSQDLKSAYTISYGNEETVAGQKAARLVLVPKDKGLADQLTKVELWVSEEGPTSGLAVQAKFYQKGGDYNMATYTNIQPRNVSESEIKLNAPKGTQRLKPIKG